MRVTGLQEKEDAHEAEETASSRDGDRLRCRPRHGGRRRGRREPRRGQPPGAARPAHVATAAKAELSAKARAALTRMLREGYKPSAELVKPGEVNLKAGASGTTSVGSYNWSGYADSSTTANTFTGVSATWRQPATQCSPEQELTAYWVGLDGFNPTGPSNKTALYAECFEGDRLLLHLVGDVPSPIRIQHRPRLKTTPAT